MPAPKSNQNAKGNRGGRPTLYKPEFTAQAAKACQAGFTDQELADLFGVAVSIISAWKAEHVEFSEALKAGKAEADDRVERALYHRLNVFSCNRLSITRYGIAATVLYTAKSGRLTGRTPGLTPRSTCHSRSPPVSQACY